MAESLGGVMPDRFQNFIDGKWVDAKSRNTFRNVNPADSLDVAVKR